MPARSTPALSSTCRAAEPDTSRVCGDQRIRPAASEVHGIVVRSRGGRPFASSRLTKPGPPEAPGYRASTGLQRGGSKASTSPRAAVRDFGPWSEEFRYGSAVPLAQRARATCRLSGSVPQRCLAWQSVRDRGRIFEMIGDHDRYETNHAIWRRLGEPGTLRVNLAV